MSIAFFVLFLPRKQSPDSQTMGWQQVAKSRIKLTKTSPPLLASALIRMIPMIYEKRSFWFADAKCLRIYRRHTYIISVTYVR